mmetsp:Transcript_28742/g.43407  ORF Transcript_28742/g.43407 Transcript_28742/m.43407 type:complete len:86 (+) Transcript_28742:620-877(+)
MQLQSLEEATPEGESSQQSQEEGLVLNFYRDAYMMANAFEAGAKTELSSVPSSMPLTTLDIINLDTTLKRVVEKDKEEPEEVFFL